MKKRTLTVLLSIAITCSLFAGCSQTAPETSGETNASHDQEPSENKGTHTVHGRVTNINGSVLTLTLENIHAPSISGSDMGTPPSLSGNHAGDPPPAQPDPNMGQPPSMPNNGAGANSTGEKQEITVTEDTVYTVQEGQESKEGSFEDIAVDCMIQAALKEDGITASSILIEKGRPNHATSEDVKLSGAKSIHGKKESSSDETFSSSSSDENAILVADGGSLNMAGAVVRKSGDSSNTDSSNFYGLNAALAVTQGSTAELTNIEITSTGEGSNAIFATGEDSSITADNVKIHTTGNSARGLDATYGGTINASSVEIATEGEHCAALATDRGEGTITVNGAALSTAGEGSPCIYSTGEISVRKATGTAAESQILVVEGKNSIELNECELEGSGPNGLMLYQSTSGDAREGTAILQASDSKLTTASNGPMIYVTNTESEITLTATELSFPGDVLINAAGNAINNWGIPGQNGGTLTLTGIRQELKGEICCDAISAVHLNLSEDSSFTGAIDKEHTAKETSIQLDDSSSWEVTGDSYVTFLKNAQNNCSNIHSNGHTVYYDASHTENQWLKGQSIELPGNGLLTPSPQ